MDTYNGNHNIIDPTVNAYECINKRRRHTFTRGQLDILEMVFSTNKKPFQEILDGLAILFGLTPYQIKIWFKNRMAKLKKSGNIDNAYRQEGSNSAHWQEYTNSEYWQEDSNSAHWQEGPNSEYWQEGSNSAYWQREYTNLSHQEGYPIYQGYTDVSPEEFFRRLSPHYMEYLGKIVDEHYVNGTFIV